MPVATPETVIQGLAPARWRNLPPAPCGIADFTFSHSQIARKYTYVDVGGDHHTGREPIFFKRTWYFLNTLEKNLFPDLFERYRNALFDGTSGDFEDPVLGLLRAVVLEGTVKVSPAVTAGVIVEATFKETRDDIEDGYAFEGAAVSMISVAQAAETAAAAYDINYPDGENEGLSLFDAVNAIESTLFSANLTYTGALNKVTGKVEQMIDAVTALNEPAAWPAQQNLLTVWTRLKTLEEKATKLATTRPVGGELLIAETTITAFAKKHGNTSKEIIDLNPSALRAPSIPKGTTLRFYVNG
jgi:hypothetical protein